MRPCANGPAANSVARKLTQELDRRAKRLLNREDCDPDYAEFFIRCEQLSKSLSSTIGRSPTPRELDKVLLYRLPGGAREAPGSTADLP